MSSNTVNLQGIARVGAQMASYLPEPSTRGVGIFQDVMRAARSITSEVVGGVSTGLGGDFAELLNVQIQAQKEMQATTMVSNIEKSKHESKMSAIRNIRVS